MDDTLLSGENAAFLDIQYAAWLADPASVEPAWRDLFAKWERPSGGRPPGPPRFEPHSIFNGRGAAAASLSAVGLDAARRQARVVQLINAYRVRGHMEADIDPLDRRDKVTSPELTLSFHGLGEQDLDAPVASSPLYGEPEISTIRAILKRLRAAYCGTIGAEFMNIQDIAQRRWLQERLETLSERRVLDRAQQLRLLRKLSDAENFERSLHNRFPGTKRFSLEGAETVIPLLDLLITEAGARGVREVVIGMAHRGRLNVLANILEKPIGHIVSEFEDVKAGTYQGSGDVKYHLGYSSDCLTPRGDRLHMSLTPNPSHLEAVDPVVEGRVRAKQDRVFDHDRAACMPVLLHGDAAFAGQGLVAEVLNLSDLKGYRTGGTVHIVINNQIGFTTPPIEARSTPYATDIARMLAIPIFHVNGEDPVAVAAVTQIATDWRQTFKRDVVIDMYCYRKHGHNEGDEPSFTQPLMYDAIRARPTPRQVCAQRIVALGELTQADADRVHEESVRAVEEQGNNRDAKPPSFESPLKERWALHVGASIHEAVDTGWPLERLRDVLVRANTIPSGFHAHPKVIRILKERLEAISSSEGVDWAIGEQAAFATLVLDGYRVRLSGQDSGRGTFSHRHAVLTDTKTGAEYFPIQHLDEKQAPFNVIDSSLSEAGVLGFEFGYSWDYPDALVMWEAQFGDFVNGAQVILDQYLVAAEQKWGRLSGLVLLLPHGYEGQGPEHSSARVERFLQACAEDNIQVVLPTTPANLYHLLRRQALRKVRKPLVVMTPKGFLRTARSPLDELANGRFQAVINDPAPPAQVRRIVLCTGKVYYDLAAMRAKLGTSDTALVRVEQLYPLPLDEIRAILDAAPGAEVVWCQEEPRNMGAWPVLFHWFSDALPDSRRIRYVGRKDAASPAIGSKKRSDQEQERLVTEALTL